MALVNDEDPSLRNYIQDQMREHFNTCNEKTKAFFSINKKIGRKQNKQYKCTIYT